MAFAKTIDRLTHRAPIRSAPVKRAHSRWRTVWRKGRWFLLGFILLLVAARIAMPFAIERYVNRQLDRVPEYGGRIGDVDVNLFRGAYEIHNVDIVKTTADVPVPFFSARKIDLSMEWRELFHGSLVGEVIMDQAEVNFVAGPTEEQSQTGEGKSWDKVLESLFPFKINRFQIRDGKAHFRNFHSTPPVDIFVDKLDAVATNLTNSREITDKLPSALTARGTTFDGGQLAIDLQLNPMASAPAFELTAQLTNVNLTALNDFLKAYGKFDVERGTFAGFTSVAAADGRYEGYVKVLLEDIDVFSWKKEKSKNVLKIGWQAIVATAATIFKNQPKDRIAAKIPVQGDWEKGSVGLWGAVSTLLQNAFVSALTPRLDQKVEIEEVRESGNAGKAQKGENESDGKKKRRVSGPQESTPEPESQSQPEL